MSTGSASKVVDIMLGAERILAIELEDLDGIAEFLMPNEYELVERSKFDGWNEIYVLLAGATPFIVDKTIAIYRAYTERNKNIKIKVDGVEITGVSEARAIEILRALKEEDKHNE